MSAIKYYRVTIKGETPFYLRVQRETTTVLTGIQVDREGEEVSGAKFDQRQRIMMKAALKTITPMRMNNKYGTLEVIK